MAQLLIKGVDSFKIDVSAAVKDSCTQYSSWKTGDNKCEVDDHNNNICCLALIGDCSSAPRYNDYFNTTVDLVNFLNNPKYDFILKKDARDPQYNRTIYIAINIQYTYIQGDITKEWVYTMVQAIQKRNLDVQLIWGGPYTIDYFGDLCANGSKLCDDKVKTIMAYPWILQNANFNPGKAKYGTYANFNIEFPSLPNFCRQYFPSYGDNLPYFFYEIAHQADAQFIYNTYMSSSCNRNPSHSDFSNIRITSNIEPEHIQTYLQANPFREIDAGTNYLIDTFEADKTLIISYFDISSKITKVQVRSLASADLPVVSFTQLDSIQYTKMSYKAPYLLLQNPSQANIFQVSTDSSLKLTPLYQVSTPGIDSDIIVYNDEVYFLQVAVSTQCPANSLAFTLTNLHTSTQVSTQCTDKITAFDIHQIQSGNLAIALDSTNNVRGIAFISAMFPAADQTKEALFAFSFRISLSQFFPIKAFTIVNPKSLIDFGVDPNVRLVLNNGTLFVLEAHSNGLCQSGNVINNGNLWKCGVSGTVSSHHAHLQNVQYLMNYNWGRLDDFEKRIQTGSYMSACDGQIMHAKFYNGEKPSGLVFRNSTSGLLQALYVNQFVDYNDLPFSSKLFCGAKMLIENGKGPDQAEFNSFNLLDYSLFKNL